MPLMRCKANGTLGWRWGQRGKCYTGAGAKQRAIRQGIAIEGPEAVRAVLNATRPIPANPLKVDPSRTKTLRRAFERELSRRFRKLKGAIIRLVVEEDAFGLKRANRIKLNALALGQIVENYNPGQPGDYRGSIHNVLLRNTRWRFHSHPEQVRRFLSWLAGQIAADIYLNASGVEAAYWDEYIRRGYLQGAGRAFEDTKVLKRAQAEGARSGTEYLRWFQGTREEFLRSSFGRPETVEKIQLLASRTLTDLKNVTGDMATRMGRVLVDGLVQGQNPRKIAQDLNAAVEVGKNRAMVIARTEILRAHAEGQLDSMEILGVQEVGAAVEWSTAGDERVCPLCRPLEGVVLKIKEARGLLPRHPQCRCAWIPANVGEDETGQARSRSRIQAAIDRSVREEIPARSKRSLARQKAISTWSGAGKAISSRRPKSVLNYNPGQPRDYRGRWTSGGGGGGGALSRSERAKRTYKPSTAAKQRRAEAEQARLAKVLGGQNTPDNMPFDILLGKHGVEVKTIMDNKHSKITMHPSSRRRKEAEARAKGLKAHTIAIDIRGGRRVYYYREGVGAYRLENMRRVSLAELRRILS